MILLRLVTTLMDCKVPYRWRGILEAANDGSCAGEVSILRVVANVSESNRDVTMEVWLSISVRMESTAREVPDSSALIVWAMEPTRSTKCCMLLSALLCAVLTVAISVAILRIPSSIDCRRPASSLRF